MRAVQGGDSLDEEKGRMSWKPDTDILGCLTMERFRVVIKGGKGVYVVYPEVILDSGEVERVMKRLNSDYHLALQFHMDGSELQIYEHN